MSKKNDKSKKEDKQPTGELCVAIKRNKKGIVLELEGSKKELAILLAFAVESNPLLREIFDQAVGILVQREIEKYEKRSEEHSDTTKRKVHES